MIDRDRSAAQEPFSEAEIFFELNDTDGDLGIHANIDGETWRELTIEGPTGTLLNIVSSGRLRAQGLTQLAFESAEPPFDELDPSDFLLRFPEGNYTIRARRDTGGLMQSTAVLSHVLAAPPGNITVNELSAAESCDEPLPTVVAPVLIEWDPVTESHPEIGKRGAVRIDRYQFFVELEDEGIGMGVDLPPSVTQFEIPRAITDLGSEFKFEIIARTSTGNNTAVETCFALQ